AAAICSHTTTDSLGDRGVYVALAGGFAWKRVDQTNVPIFLFEISNGTLFFDDFAGQNRALFAWKPGMTGDAIPTGNVLPSNMQNSTNATGGIVSLQNISGQTISTTLFDLDAPSASPMPIVTFKNYSEFSGTSAFFPDSRHLAIDFNGDVQIWDL